jgi:endoglucanase
LPNTGGWQSWETVSHQVTLRQGSQKIAIKATAPGWNLNWLQVSLS